MGETVAFNICDKPFKPLGITSGRVKSREGLTEMMPTSIANAMLLKRMKFHTKNGFYS
jgi:hypothetical protein